MRKFTRLALILLLIAIIAGLTSYYWYSTRDAREPSKVSYLERCAQCHGTSLEGNANGPALISTPLLGGDSTDALISRIAAVHTDKSTVAWLGEAPDYAVKALALFISERRQAFPSTSESYQRVHAEETVDSQHHRFLVHAMTRFSSAPYALEPLPDGRILVSEKSRGLRIVNADGTQNELLTGIPKVWAPIVSVDGASFSLGMLMDVELHPDYENNGWVYLSHGDRCQLDCGSVLPVSMVRVVRGRIKDQQWVDQEIIWSVHHDYYTVVPDTVASGRLAFDNDNNLYLTIGGKAHYRNLHKLDTPYGKIHRVRDDGTVPDDNPLWVAAADRPESSTRHTVWSYGHRTAQGLTSHPISGAIWSTEMGPRGGDELNKIVGGGNYGWPLYTNGLDYDAEPLSIGMELGLDFAFDDTVPPVVDFTPAPALSNANFYHGSKFPQWENDLLIGSLKAHTLYRVRIHAEELIEMEKLHTQLGRIRDIEVGTDGSIYVATEDLEGGALYQLLPADD